jgi:hypothetical protein
MTGNTTLFKFFFVPLKWVGRLDFSLNLRQMESVKQ